VSDNSGDYGLSWRDWVEASRLQLRVLAALVRRETRAHFGERRLGYLWAVIEPALHLLVYMVLFTYILRRHNPVGGSLPLFIVTGVTPYFMYYKQATYLAGSVVSNRSLLNLPLVKPFDIMIARAILEAVIYLVVGFIMLLTLYLAGVSQAVPRDPLTVAEAIGGIVTFGFGLGMINAVLREFIPSWPTLFAFFLGPLWLLSGLFFLVDEIPEPARGYLLYNPVLHFIIWFRSGFYPGYSLTYLDRSYALKWSSACLLLGLVLVRVAHRKLLEPE
jgi:capsular polysaccharide transport system permease protein